MSSKTSPLKDNLDLLFTTSAHRRRGLLLALLSGAAGLGTYLFLGTLPPSYEATTTLVAEAPIQAPSGTPDIQWKPAARSAALLAPDRLSAIVDRLKLAERGDFLAPAGLQQRLAGLMARLGLMESSALNRQTLALEQLRQSVTASPGKETTSIVVRVTGRDARLAAQIAQTVAALEIEDLTRRVAADLQTHLQKMDGRIEGLRREIGALDSQIATNRAHAAVSRPDEITRADTKRAELQQRAKLAREMLARGQVELMDDIRSLPQIEPLLQQRTRVSRQLSELPAAGRADQRRREELEAERRSIERRLGEEFGRIVWALEREALDAAAAVDAIKSASPVSAEKLQAMLQERDAKLSETAGLERQANGIRAVLSGTVPLPVRAVSMPPQASPSWPNSETLAVLVGLGVFIVAGGFVAIGEIVTGSTHRVRTGTLEVTGLEATGVQMVNIPDAVARILIAAMEKPGFRTLVVGAAAGVSSSAEVKAVATALANDGRSVLVVDVTRDRLGHRASRGLIDVLQDGSFAGAIVGNPETGVQVLGWQGTGTPADAVIEPFALNQLMDVLDEVYDHILITGVYADAASFFEAIEGRVDLAFEVGRTQTAMVGPYVRILGYDVVDLVVLPLAPVGRRVEAGSGQSARAA